MRQCRDLRLESGLSLGVSRELLCVQDFGVWNFSLALELRVDRVGGGGGGDNDTMPAT